MIHLDVVGEGRHALATNLNPSLFGALGPIPRLIIGLGQAIPARSRSIDVITAEHAPLHILGMVDEIARVVRPGGTVVLINPTVYKPTQAAHASVMRRLAG